VSAVPTLHRVPPGRAGLLWLRHRLDTAGRGLNLLRRKQAILLQEAHRLRILTEVTRREWHDLDRAGRRWLLRAAVLGGGRAVRFAVPSGRAMLSPRSTTVIGVRCPAEPGVELPDPVEGPVVAGPAVGAAVAAYRMALPAAARHAAVAAAHAAVADEIVQTRQRVRALERRWIPQLEAALAGIRLQMSELEDADAVRLRKAAGADARRGGRQ
jgi:V/A-type H+/Na+-transporting ATPase subunit D